MGFAIAGQSPQCFNMSPKELVQDTVQYNKRLNLVRKLLKAYKCSETPSPFRLTSSQTSKWLPRASDPVAKEHMAPSAATTKPRTSRRPRKSKPVLDHVRPTPMAELKHNYKMVLSRLQPASLAAAKDNPRREVRRQGTKSDSLNLANTPVQRPGYVQALSSLLHCLAQHADLFPGSDIPGLYCHVARNFRR